jgi:AraC-like DNA-binding protein
MGTGQVRVWRAHDEDRVLLMAGETTQYAVEPRGEYIFGIVTRRAMRARRGSERHLVVPGEVVAWDPSADHAGTAVDSQPWSARLMVLEVADLAALAGDKDSELPVNVHFPKPVIRDPQLAQAFLRMHIALDTTTTRLERDERLTSWLHSVIEQFSSVRSRRTLTSPREEQAFRAACNYLAERSERNISLDELADAAGIGKFRLVRLFRDRTGLGPHAIHIAHRIRIARRLLEAGESIAVTAAATGFADQSHLHRHLQRTLGLTPGAYRRRVTSAP